MTRVSWARAWRRALTGLVSVASIGGAAYGQTTTSYVYDALGRLVSAIDNTGPAVVYGYDQAGNRIRHGNGSIYTGLTPASYAASSGVAGITGLTVSGMSDASFSGASSIHVTQSEASPTIRANFAATTYVNHVSLAPAADASLGIGPANTNGSVLEYSNDNGGTWRTAGTVSNAAAGVFSVVVVRANVNAIRLRRTTAGQLALGSLLFFSAPGGASAPGERLVANNDTGLTVAAGASVSLDPRVNDTHLDSLPFTVSAVGQGAFGTVSKNAAGTQVTYAAGAAASGLDTFWYEIADGTGRQATAEVKVTVTAPAANVAPSAVADTASATTGVATSINVIGNDSDPNNDPLIVTGATTPSHGTTSINTGTNTVTYTATGGYTGPDSFNYTISDGRGGTATAAVAVTVLAAGNTPPVAVDDSGTVSANVAVTVTPLINDTDANGDPLRITSVSNPSHGTATINTGETSVTYTATAGYAGPDSFTYAISDGRGGVANATVSIMVSNGWSPSDAGSGVIEDLDANDTTKVTISAGEVTNWASRIGSANYQSASGSRPALVSAALNGKNVIRFDGTNDVMTGDAAAKDATKGKPGFTMVALVRMIAGSSYAGIYTASNGNASNTPRAQLGVYFAPANFGDGTSGSLARGLGDLTDSGSAVETAGGIMRYGVWRIITISVDGQGGKIKQRAEGFQNHEAPLPISGSFPNTPSLVAQLGRALGGQYFNGQVAHIITSSNASNDEIAKIEGYLAHRWGQPGLVHAGHPYATTPPAAANGVPIVANDAALAISNVAKSISPLVNDRDPNWDPLTITTVSTPANGTAAIVAGASVTYTSNPGYSGADSFTYTVSDGKGGTATAIVNVTVNPANNAPFAANDIVAAISGVAKAVNVTTNDYDVDNDGLTVVAVTTPGHGVANITGPTTVTYTATGGYSGADSFTYSISDGRGGTATATVNVTVSSPNAAPVAVNDTGTVAAGMAATVTPLTNDSDPNGDTLTVTSVTSPAHGTATINTGATSITYTATGGYSGADSFTYTISDGRGGSATATVNLSVTSTWTPSVLGAQLLEDLDASDPSSLTVEGVGTVTNWSSKIGGSAYVQPTSGLKPEITANALNGKNAVRFNGTSDYLDGNAAAKAITGGKSAFSIVALYRVTSGSASAGIYGASITAAADTTRAGLRVGDVAGAANAVMASSRRAEADTSTNFQGGSSPQGVWTLGVFTANPVTGVLTLRLNGTQVASAATATNGGPFASGASARANIGRSVNGLYYLNGHVAQILTTATVATADIEKLEGYLAHRWGQAALLATGHPYKANPPGAAGNTAPVAVNDNGTAGAGVAATITPLTNDSDADGDTLTITGVSTPGHGSATINSGSTSITYTAASNYTGPDSFTYTISDGKGANATATVNLTVTAISNTPPVAVNDAVTAISGVAKSISPLGNDSDADGGTLTITAVSTPGHGTAAINPGATSVTYTATGGYSGSDSFSYTVFDGQGGSAVATVNVTVSAPAVFSDNFDRANQNVEASSNWTLVGPGGKIVINNNRIDTQNTSFGNGLGTAVLSPDLGATNHYVQGRAGGTAKGDPATFLVARFTDIDNFVGVRFSTHYPSTHRVEVYTRINGVFTELAEYQGARLDSDIMRLNIVGSTYELLVNGTTVVAPTTATMPPASTRTGIFTSGGGVGFFTDDFQAGAIY